MQRRTATPGRPSLRARAIRPACVALTRAAAATAAAFLASAFLAAGAVPAAAQGVRGIVIDAATEQPVDGADVVLLDTLGNRINAVSSDTTGRFLLLITASGRYQLRASRIGYKDSMSRPIYLDRHELLPVELRLSTEAIEIAPLTVTANTTMFDRDMAGFRRRAREDGFGYFMTPEQLKGMHLPRASSYLARAPGIRIRYGQGGRALILLSHAGRTCSPNLVIDGLPYAVDGSLSIDDLLRPDEVHAVEVYGRVEDVPPHFLGFRPNCGAVVVWTNRGQGWNR